MEQRDRPALSEKRRYFQHESGGVILEFGDLSIEGNRVHLIEAMILDLVLPGDHSYAHRLEAAICKLPRSAMNELIATRAKVYEAHRKNAALILKGFQDVYVPQGDAETIDPLFQS